MRNDCIHDREVSWKVFDIPLYGTITEPTNTETHPAVIFVAGSGPTDRNWCSPLLPGTNGSAKLLAEALASQGFVTLRYDKLASGPNIKENISKLVGKISMQSHLKELAGAVEIMLAEKNVYKDNLFVLTNSEGAIHAVNYQLQAKSNRFKGLVLTGAPGRAVGEVSRSQIFNQVKNLPNEEALMKSYDDAIAEFLANKPMTKDIALPEDIKPIILSLQNPANLPFTRELWTYSLPEHLSKLDVPTLVVIGKKDIQVNWKIDGHELEKATAKKNDMSFIYPKNANHVLKHEVKPLEEITAQYAALRYNAPDAELDRESVNAILNWLKTEIKHVCVS
jgi:pimeloyl-ACP methyl ester carboxylesterase